MFPIANGVPLRYPPVATWALIAANCVIFLFQLSLSPLELDLFLDRYALIPARYFDAGGFDSAMSPSDYLPFASNMFLHGGWLHLILNMWTLWLFGPAVEDRLGPDRYLIFYLAAGARRLRCHRRHSRLLYQAVPACPAGRPDPDPVLSFLLRSTGGRLCQPL